MRIILGFITASLLAACGGSTLVAKGTLPKPASGNGVLALFVESSARINRAEFGGGGESFNVATIALGSTLQLHTVPTGNYCLSMLEWGMGGAGAVLNIEEETYCFTVTEKETTYAGHLVVSVEKGRGSMSPVNLSVESNLEEAIPELQTQHPGLLDSFPMQASK